MKKFIVVLGMLFTGMNLFSQVAVIKELSGTVEIKRPSDSAFVTAKQGDRIGDDTVINTGFKSTALLIIGSCMITVRPITRLTLLEIRNMQGTETINVNLQTGKVRVDVNPPAGTGVSAKVTGPSATASVRGTGFELDTLGLYVITGRVEYRGNLGTPVYVEGGFESTVLNDGTPSNPYINMRRGFRPPAPVGYDPSCNRSGLAWPNEGGSAGSSGQVTGIDIVGW